MSRVRGSKTTRPSPSNIFLFIFLFFFILSYWGISHSEYSNILLNNKINSFGVGKVRSFVHSTPEGGDKMCGTETLNRL